MSGRPVTRATLLLAGWLAVASGCVPREPAEIAQGGDPHGALACAECHDGPLADRSLAAVPSASCAGAGCHAEVVPGVQAVGSVPFDHDEHGSTEAVAVGCAGCHTHADGDEPLSAGAATCGLCHRDELSGERPEDCRLCHSEPTHSGFTSQGVAVPHEGLPWIEGGCLRCHYEVTHPVREVPLDACAECHEAVEDLSREAAGENLHPRHAAVSCTACHESDNHRIESMSSAVNLECASCHLEEHELTIRDEPFPSAACNQCHREQHAEPQTLLLGVALADAQPAPHFSEGLTCRSCHGEAAENVENRPVPTTGDACVDCHQNEYRTVLRWWEEGVAGRTGLVDRYLGAAEAALGPESAELAGARELLGLVRRGAGEHNLPLTHRLLQSSLERVGAAYRAAGRTPPAAPGMGRDPRPGLCTYCHYRVNEPGMTEQMDDAFHRAVMGR